MTVPGWVRRLLPTLLIAAAFGFLGAEILGNAEQLRSFRWEIRPMALLASLAALVLVLLWGVWIWREMLRRFGVRVGFVPLARAWFLSNVSRYIPGVVWQFVSLAQAGGEAGLTGAAAVTSLLVQMGFMLLSAMLVGVYLLPSELAGGLSEVLVALRWAAPLGVAAVHPSVIRFFLRHAARIARRPALPWKESWAAGLWLLLLSSSAWFAFGGALFLFLRAWVDLPLSALPAVTAMNALAFVAGYLAFFAPGGLGFKDAALTLLLAGLVPPAVAASLAVAARLWNVTGEAIPALVLFPRRFSRPPPGPSDAPTAGDPARAS